MILTGTFDPKQFNAVTLAALMQDCAAPDSPMLDLCQRVIDVLAERGIIR